MEVLVQDTSLTAIANAIREQARTEDSLKFPDGFVSAISSLLPGNVIAITGGTYVPANSPKSLSINHGMGATPNFALVSRVDEPSSGDYIRGTAAFRIPYNQYQVLHFNIYSFEVENDEGETDSRGDNWSLMNDYALANTWNDELFTVRSGGDNVYMGGATYSWVAGVIENLF